MAGALRTGISGFVVRKILFLHNEISLVPTSDEQRISADLSAANSVLDDLIRIGERVCSNVTYRKNSSENSINDFLEIPFRSWDIVKSKIKQGMVYLQAEMMLVR